ncbi:MAG: hypothetical protein E7016_03070 [Alphaproteobacteria bacterium]|nr:hypothetical protein [Alphaproteobacteria bacterium]
MTERNKLNIYYIKPSKTITDVFKDDPENYKKFRFEEGILYYKPKHIREPDWVQGFFKQSLMISYTDEGGVEHKSNIFNTASSQAVFIREFEDLNGKHMFAIPFGTGIHMLKSDSYMPNFGLKCVLNLISEDTSLRKLSKYDISSSPKQTSQQLSKKGSQIDFNLDYQTDILTGITGSLNEKNERDRTFINLIGKTITGTNKFSVSAKADIKNIDKILKLVKAAYNSSKYKKKGFGWIDNVSYIKNDSMLLEKLNAELDIQLQKISDENEKIWLAVPEMIKWEEITGFYFGRDKKKLVDDLNLIQYKNYLESKDKPFNINTLKQNHIYAKDAQKDEPLYTWDAFQCLNAEIELSNGYQKRTFMLIDKNWYEVNKDFKSDTDKKFNDYFNNTSDIQFIECNFPSEDNYNKEMAKQKNLICMDKNVISYGGGNSKIEVCDLLDEIGKKIIHVKKYSGSSVLSHLFSQGLVSMQLLIKDKKFLRNAEKRISEVKGDNFVFNNARDYDLVYAIITKSGYNTINMPFFSKVNLNSVCDRLCQEMNVKVYFDVIKNIYKKNKAN